MKGICLAFLKSLREAHVIIIYHNWFQHQLILPDRIPAWRPKALLLQSIPHLFCRESCEDFPAGIWSLKCVLFQGMFPFSVFFHVPDASCTEWIITFIRISMKQINFSLSPHPFLSWRVGGLFIKGCVEAASLAVGTGNFSVLSPYGRAPRGCAGYGSGSQERDSRSSG